MKTKLLFSIALAFIGLSANAQWQQTSGPYGGGAIQCLATNGTTIFAGTYSAGMSSYNGSTWTTINSGLTATDVQALTMNGSNVFAGTYGGITGGVWTSTDNGSSWTQIYTTV